MDSSSDSDSGSDSTSSSESEEPEMDATNLLVLYYITHIYENVYHSTLLNSQLDMTQQEEIPEKLWEYLEVGNLFLQKAGTLAWKHKPGIPIHPAC